jgi:hypothetical protein
MEDFVTRLFPCYCYGDDPDPYCPRYTPLPGEEEYDVYSKGNKDSVGQDEHGILHITEKRDK